MCPGDHTHSEYKQEALKFFVKRMLISLCIIPYDEDDSQCLEQAERRLKLKSFIRPVESTHHLHHKIYLQEAILISLQLIRIAAALHFLYQQAPVSTKQSQYLDRPSVTSFYFAATLLDNIISLPT